MKSRVYWQSLKRRLAKGLRDAVTRNLLSHPVSKDCDRVVRGRYCRVRFVRFKHVFIFRFDAKSIYRWRGLSL